MKGVSYVSFIWKLKIIKSSIKAFDLKKVLLIEMKALVIKMLLTFSKFIKIELLNKGWKKEIDDNNLSY